MVFYKKKLSRDQALKKLYRYCAYQERCRQDVIRKLVEFGFDKDDNEKLIDQLLRENYINEERYAKTFVRGKFGIKKWGSQKIIRILSHKGISESLIQSALREITENEYEDVMKKLIESKSRSIREPDLLKKKYKIARFVIGKGFSSEMVWALLNSLTLK